MPRLCRSVQRSVKVGFRVFRYFMETEHLPVRNSIAKMVRSLYRQNRDLTPKSGLSIIAIPIPMLGVPYASIKSGVDALDTSYMLSKVASGKARHPGSGVECRPM